MTTPTTSPQLVTLDARTLAAHPTNVRYDLGDLTDLANSITEHGLLEPIVVAPLNDGGHRIIAGHRRTAAAILAERYELSAIVRPDLVDDAGQQVATMLVENLHRQNLTDLEEAHGYHQLKLAGWSATKIAKQAARSAIRVKTALNVAGSEVATAVGQRHQRSLEHLALATDRSRERSSFSAHPTPKNVALKRQKLVALERHKW